MKNNSIFFEVDGLPPSVNGIWRKGRDRRGRDRWYKEARAVEWTQKAVIKYLSQRPGCPGWESRWPIQGIVSIRVDFFDKDTKAGKPRIWDLDNRLKVVLDSLTAREKRSKLEPVLQDDRLVWDIETHRHRGKREQVFITIMEAEFYRSKAAMFCRENGMEYFAEFYNSKLPGKGGK